MTLEFSIDGSLSSLGNHFIIGLDGTTLSDLDKEILSKLRPTGVLLLKRNFDHSLPYPEWLKSLTKLLKDVREITEREEMLITLDHECERVMRTPSPLTIFPNSVHFKDHADRVARAQAKELRSLGVNLSWAPVADIHSNPSNPIIGERAFGHTAEEVISYAVPYAKALQNEGIIGCAKHFPGHGDTSTDSHLELPRVDLNESELKERELKPFKALIDINIPTIMTAHILYPNIDRDYPATMSEKIINQILRKDLGFNGVVISDDLDMKAVSDSFNRPETIARSLNIGCDMFIIARHDPKSDRTLQIAEGFADSVMNRSISEEALFTAFQRIDSLFRDHVVMHEPFILSDQDLLPHSQLANAISSR